MTNCNSDEVDRLLEFLKDRDVECPLCGYNLRNLTRPVCPECKQELMLTVGLQKIRFGWFIITIAPGIFSGIAAFILLVPMLVIPAMGGGPAPWFIVATDVFGWTSGVATLVVIANRNAFLRNQVNVQIAWACLIWAIHLTAFALLLCFMFGVLP